MDSAREYVAYYLERLRQGWAEDAFFGLIEGGPAVVPALIEVFAREQDRAVRAQIVRCVWQHRRRETVGFLAGLLCDPDQVVWKEALDGLATIGGSEAVRALQEVRARLPADGVGRGITARWVDEALEQLRERGPE